MNLSSILRQILDKCYLYHVKVAEKIEQGIARLDEGTTFKYKELGITPEEYPAATKAIGRLVSKGIIKRASTGVFYKPKKTVFGPLRPTEQELLRPYLFQDNKRIAYITGTSLYNQMGLTTQVPKVIKVASRDKRIITTVGNIRVKPVKSYAEVTNENYRYMELLDVLKDFKNIPDKEVSQTIRFLLEKIRSMLLPDREKLIEMALRYPPRVRAFLGALLTQLYPGEKFPALYNSLNPLTKFDLGLQKNTLATAEYWNIC